MELIHIKMKQDSLDEYVFLNVIPLNWIELNWTHLKLNFPNDPNFCFTGKSTDPD
jgi:hypothetical protein